MSKKTIAYQERANLVKHPLTKQLLHLMASKKTNLALSADVTRKKELLTLADAIGPEICVFKTHIDIIEDFDADLTKQLKQLASKHNFLLFEDRKFADIGNTVQLQYRAGIYHIAEWADIINAHSIPGPGVIQGLKNSGQSAPRGLLLLAEMSSQGTLARDDYTQATVKMAQQHKDFVIGFIAQHKLVEDPDFLYLTPGISLNEKSDQLSQGYIEPAQAIIQNGTDIIIVGRGIYQAQAPKQAAQQFRELGWQAYLQCLNN
jgi:uridine monophosphate synthetase